MTTKRSSDESGDEVGRKAKKQHAMNTLSLAGEVSEEDEQRGWEAEVEEEKKRTRSGNPKPKPKPIHHNNGASGTPPMEGKRRKKKQLDEIYDLLQAAVAKVGEKLPVPENVAIGGPSHTGRAPSWRRSLASASTPAMTRWAPAGPSSSK